MRELTLYLKANIEHSNLKLEASAMNTCGRTKQIWSWTCLKHIYRMKMAMILRLGHSFAKIGTYLSKKCDIYATLYHSTYSGDLTPQCKIFYISRNKGGNGKFYTKCMYLLDKHSTTTKNIMVDHGRVGQFFPVFTHLARETFFSLFFWSGRPKSPLIV